MERDAYLEALLFYRGEPVEIKELAKVLECTAKDIEESLITLKKRLEGSGIALLRVNTSVELASAPGAAKLIERIRKEELSKDLGKAGSETLAIILYRSPVTRAEIDYLRGVNSTFILRNLMIRGLIERVPNPSDQRSFCYRPTLDLLQYLGVTQLDDLPDFEKTKREFTAFMQEKNDGTRT